MTNWQWEYTVHIELIKSSRNNRIYIENILNNYDKIYTTTERTTIALYNK
jgi:hypothetical protein